MNIPEFLPTKILWSDYISSSGTEEKATSRAKRRAEKSAELFLVDILQRLSVDLYRHKSLFIETQTPQNIQLREAIENEVNRCEF